MRDRINDNQYDPISHKRRKDVTPYLLLSSRYGECVEHNAASRIDRVQLAGIGDIELEAGLRVTCARRTSDEDALTFRRLHKVDILQLRPTVIGRSEPIYPRFTGV